MEFADIALAKFLQSAPELGPLIINFSEITDQMEEESTGTKVGIFLLKAGMGVVTVPVIARGDTVFPIDSVFLESEAKFRPLSPSTISYILSAASSAVGKTTKIPETVDTNPNLQNLINPPRTGKFTYATSSRLTEFLAAIPNNLKQFVFEKVSSEQSLYNTLDKLFGLRALFVALNGHNGGSGTSNSTESGNAPRVSTSLSVVTSPREVGDLMNESLSKSFIDKGYVIIGGGDSFRAATAYQPYNIIGSFRVVNPAMDGGREFDVVMKNGSTKRAYLPNYHILSPNKKESSTADGLVSILEDGTYVRGNVIAGGDATEGTFVLNRLFDLRPPKLLRELERGETFLMFTTSGQALGPFTASSVTRTSSGVEVKTYSSNVNKICGYQNFTKEIDRIGDSLFTPSNIIVLSLGEDVTFDAEISINDAADKRETIAAQYLGAEMDIRHDGIEFSMNGTPVGPFPSAMKVLVETERLDPDMAENFLKQAEETKFVKIFMSKAASTTDFNPTPIQNYGESASKPPEIGLNGSFIPAVQSAADLGDSQALESTIIAQLLQVPDLFEYIQEYLPEIEETVDKLGRVLFLTRSKIDKLSESLDSDSVFSLISQIKSVYRQLGDMSLKLKGITEASLGFDPQASNQTT